MVLVRRHRVAVPLGLPFALDSGSGDCPADSGLVLVVGADDALHQVVAHHVAIVKIGKCQPFNVS